MMLSLKKLSLKKSITTIILFTLLCTALIYAPSYAQAEKVTPISVTGASAQGSSPSYASDGNSSTLWLSPEATSMHDYRRFLDFDFGGTFAISEINIKNKLGSYYHYEVYLSSDGTNYKKVAFKNTDTQAEAQGDTYSLSSPVTAAYARINVSFNSSSQQVNLAEVTFFGEHISNDSPKPEAITIENFAQSSWGKEWNAAASDPSYAGQKLYQNYKIW